MESDKNWLKFIISGSVEDYLNYVNSCKNSNIAEGENYGHHHRRPCDKGNEYRG